jgi:hypothetical protein
MILLFPGGGSHGDWWLLLAGVTGRCRAFVVVIIVGQVALRRSGDVDLRVEVGCF